MRIHRTARRRVVLREPFETRIRGAHVKNHPVFFAPMRLTTFKDRERFVADSMLKEHWELMLTCWDHNFKHLRKLYRLLSGEHGTTFKTLIRGLIVLIEGWVRIRRNNVLHKAQETKLRRGTR